jgi:membrane fusion protein, multidrug efflux system
VNYRNLFAIASILLLAAACGNSAGSETAAVSTELPDDVRSVAAISSPASTTEQTPERAVASEEGGKLTATGEFVSPSQSNLSPKFAGRVAEIYVDAGARVRRGQPLLKLETTYAQLGLRQAEAELARATAAAEEAHRDLERKTELRGKNSIPQALFDRSEAMARQAAAARSSAETAVVTARQRIDDSVLRSPMTGVVASRNAGTGEFLGDGAVPFVIAQTSPLKLRFRVPERYLARLSEGQNVSATVDPYPGETFDGRVKTVGQVIDPSTRTFFAEAEFDNSDGRLRPGLFARVEAELR